MRTIGKPVARACLAGMALTAAIMSIGPGQAQEAFGDAITSSLNDAVKSASEEGHRQAVQLASGETISALLFKADLDIDDVSEGDGFVVSAWPIAPDRLIFRLASGIYRELDLTLGAMVDVTDRMETIRAGRAFAFGHVDRTMALADDTGAIKVSPGFWQRGNRHIGDSARPVTAIALSSGGRAVLHGDIAGQATIWDVSDRRQSPVGPGFDKAVTAVAIADDLNLMTIAAGREVAVVSTRRLERAAASIEATSTVRDVEMLSERDRGVVILHGDSGAELFSVDAASGELRPLTLPACPSIRHLWRNGRTAVAECGNGSLAVQELLSTGVRPLGTALRSPPGLALAYPSSDANVLFIMAADGRFGVFDRPSGRQILEGIMTRDGWIVVDEKGRFDGEGIDPSSLAWSLRTRGDQRGEVRFDQLSHAFRYPGLLQSVFGGSGARLRSAVFDPAGQGLPLPPEITEIRFLEKHERLDQPLQVIATAADISGHAINDVRLYHNGRLVTPARRFLDKSARSRTDEVNEVAIRSVAYQVDPVPGRNEFKAVSEGIGAILSTRADGQNTTLVADMVGERGASRLHVLGIGIGRFGSPALALDFPAHSVTSVADLLFEKKIPAMADGQKRLLLDDRASKPAIEAAFDDLKAASRPEDTVVVYLSGHGVYRNERWYFPLPNASSLDRLGSDNAIDHHQLQDLLAGIEAHNILLLVDACHAGAASGALDVIEMRRLTGQVSDRAGVSLIAASRATQEAIEAKTIGYGLFSAALIEGLSGKADIAGDGAVSAFELARYAQEKIPAYSLEFQQSPQIPESRLGGSDFALTRSN